MSGNIHLKARENWDQFMSGNRLFPQAEVYALRNLEVPAQLWPTWAPSPGTLMYYTYSACAVLVNRKHSVQWQLSLRQALKENVCMETDL